MQFGFIASLRFVWLACTLAALVSSQVQASPQQQSDVHLWEPSVSLTSYFELLEDPSQTLTLADVQTPEVANRFKAVSTPAEALNFGFTRSAYWLRLRLHNGGAVPIEKMLEIAYSRISLIALHQSLPAGGFQSVYTGSTLPFASRPHPNRNFVFPIALPAQSDTLVLMRIQTVQPFIVPARLWSAPAYHAHERNDYAAQMWYFGMAAAMLLFNLLLFVALREPLYLVYVGAVACMSLMMASQNGLAKEFLWPNSTDWDNFATSIGYALSTLAILAFMRMMLNTRQWLPRWDLALRACMAFLALMVIGFLASFYSLIKLAAGFYGLAAILVVVVSVCGIYRRQRSAYFFLGAFAVLMLGAMLASLRALGMVPTHVLTTNGLQIGSACEMILLAFALADRYNQLRRERARMYSQAQRAENETLLAQAKAEHAQAQADVQQAHNATLQVQAELAQAQLVQSEKMASLGQLVASVTHEINTPIGAIKSSGSSMTEALQDVINQLPPLLQGLDAATNQLLVELLRQANRPKAPLSSREERVIVKKATEQMEAAGLPQARQKAIFLVNFNVQDAIEKYLPLLQHPDHAQIMEAASNLSLAMGCAKNVNVAVERVAKIVLALKSFSHFNPSQEKIEAQLVEGIETVLTIFQGQTKVGVSIERNYEDIAPIACLEDELNQVWTNLIHNALQAMNHTGTLTIGIRREGNDAVVSVGDSGCGIPEDIRSKIFDVFFTTKPAGVGSGLGLDIVKKIIDKHHGRIDLQSTVGVGTTFSVYLPYDR